MTDNQIRAGKITKIVHVRFAATSGGDEANVDGSHGYGILQGDDGYDVFFVDSALQDAQLTELEKGRDTLYIMESGPLGRAAKVWTTRKNASQLEPAGTNCRPMRSRRVLH